MKAKGSWVGYVCASIYFVASCMALCAERKLDFIAIVLLIVALTIGISYLLYNLRVITLDDDGCTIRLLCFKRHYTWEELPIRMMVRYERTNSLFPYKYAVWFSKSYKKFPTSNSPFFIVRNLFSSFSVIPVAKEELAKTRKSLSDPGFTVEKEELLDLLKRIDIHVDGLNE